MENGFSSAGPNGFSSLADGFSMLPLNQYKAPAKREVTRYKSFPNVEQRQSGIFGFACCVSGGFNLIHTTGLTTTVEKVCICEDTLTKPTVYTYILCCVVLSNSQRWIKVLLIVHHYHDNGVNKAPCLWFRGCCQ